MTALAAMHVAKKRLGLDDDTYRDILERMTGKRSARDMSEAERRAALDEFRRLGSPLPNPSPQVGGAKRRRLEGPHAKKLQALWIAGWNLGVVRERDDAAMLAFVRRQTGLDDTRFLWDAADGRAAIEALKAWLTREAGVDWAARKLWREWQNQPGFRIAQAQWRLLSALNATPLGLDFKGLVESTLHMSIADLRAREWADVMNYLGRALRAAARREDRSGSVLQAAGSGEAATGARQ